MNNKNNFQPVLYTKEIESYVNKTKLDPYWISGFVAGEGCFMILINRQTKTPSVHFAIALTTTDQHILWAI
jgi:hypothetical protein